MYLFIERESKKNFNYRRRSFEKWLNNYIFIIFKCYLNIYFLFMEYIINIYINF